MSSEEAAKKILHYEEGENGVEDLTFKRRSSDQKLVAHQPIYGLGKGPSAPNHLVRLARTCRIFNILDHLNFESILDVGGAEGFTAYRAQKLYGCSAMSVDYSLSANKAAGETFGLPNVAIDASFLPFKDNSFDVVLCTEVIEHTKDAAMAILQLARVAKKCVIISTMEATPSQLERAIALRLLHRDWRDGWTQNWFSPSDFHALVGADAKVESQLFIKDYPWNRNEAKLAPEEARQVVRALMGDGDFHHGSEGVLVHWLKDPSCWRTEARHGEESLLNQIVGYPGIENDPTLPQTGRWPEPSLDLMQCPVCWGKLHSGTGDQLLCGNGHTFTQEEGVYNFHPAYLTEHAAAVFEQILQTQVAQLGSRTQAIRKIRNYLTRPRPQPSAIEIKALGLGAKAARFALHPVDAVRFKLGISVSPFQQLPNYKLPNLELPYG